MPEIKNQYFTISELANLCGVTKHTLFHYDEIGLLKPEFINAKGYRYYSFRQSYLLDIINVLKKAGSSLQEIKEFIQNQNTPLLVKLFKQKQHELEVELLRIKRMQDILGSAIQMTEKTMEALLDVPCIEECEEEYFIATPLEQGDDKEFFIKLSEHRDYCEKHFINHEFPIWTIISEERFESGDYTWGWIANRLKEPISGENMITKPKGVYAVMDHKGSYETLTETCSIIKKYIGRNGMKVCGNAYTMDLLNYFSEQNPNDYVIRVSVEVSL
ncbi:MerR family transcriptional regulator [Paenibacillus lutrae]|uniref:MerR family transcriptional regulator n=1 Tax=Paenibacillus lutrae TaxID=2078573 RepID=A0A7X3FEL7_9BACL|nr:MerR family transcriptional regulator [Paenibacillus lutrae]MVO98242.1 MerR family transcriptional regulator [Paenibacillus lutrae]